MPSLVITVLRHLNQLSGRPMHAQGFPAVKLDCRPSEIAAKPQATALHTPILAPD